jgi:hypothetical protein
MEQYHWSYEDYMNTPKWVIELIIKKGNIEAKKQKIETKTKGWK